MEKKSKQNTSKTKMVQSTLNWLKTKPKLCDFLQFLGCKACLKKGPP